LPVFKDQTYSIYSAKQIFDMVGDVEKYPEFLPWCSAAKIINKENNILKAELAIGYNSYSLSYTSLVTLISDEKHNNYAIDVEAISGPFKYLINKWNFTTLTQGGCDIEFFIDFAFESLLFEKLIGGFLEKSLNKMVKSFEKRAKKLYG
jgi:coenzyme Q-binding protein COQ10